MHHLTIKCTKLSYGGACPQTLLEGQKSTTVSQNPVGNIESSFHILYKLAMEKKEMSEKKNFECRTYGSYG